jgi:hypothetical protein
MLGDGRGARCVLSKYCRIIEHGIVLQDFAGIVDPQESMQAIADARAFMETLPKGEVLVLTDATKAVFNREIAGAMQGLADHHTPWVLASAVVGLTPLMRLAFRTVVLASGREIKALESRTAAIAYLLGRRNARSRTGHSG